LPEVLKYNIRQIINEPEQTKGELLDHE
jgi:hypothetical protein